jgi:hypothetical protein
MTLQEEIINDLCNLVRKLRKQLYKKKSAHERQWETRQEEKTRDRLNAENLNVFDRETEQMITCILQRVKNG